MNEQFNQVPQEPVAPAAVAAPTAAPAAAEKPKTRRSRSKKAATDGEGEAVVVDEKKAKPAAKKTATPKVSGSKAAAQRTAGAKRG